VVNVSSGLGSLAVRASVSDTEALSSFTETVQQQARER
jgi:hypothetical protein